MQLILLQIPVGTTIEQLSQAVQTKLKRFGLFSPRFKMQYCDILDIYDGKERLVESHGLVSFQPGTDRDKVLNKLEGILVNGMPVQVRGYEPRGHSDAEADVLYQVTPHWRRANINEVRRSQALLSQFAPSAPAGDSQTGKVPGGGSQPTKPKRADKPEPQAPTPAGPSDKSPPDSVLVSPVASVSEKVPSDAAAAPQPDANPETAQNKILPLRNAPLNADISELDFSSDELTELEAAIAGVEEADTLMLRQGPPVEGNNASPRDAEQAVFVLFSQTSRYSVAGLALQVGQMTIGSLIEAARDDLAQEDRRLEEYSEVAAMEVREDEWEYERELTLEEAWQATLAHGNADGKLLLVFFDTDTGRQEFVQEAENWELGEAARTLLARNGG